MLYYILRKGKYYFHNLLEDLRLLAFIFRFSQTFLNSTNLFIGVIFFSYPLILLKIIAYPLIPAFYSRMAHFLPESLIFFARQNKYINRAKVPRITFPPRDSAVKEEVPRGLTRETWRHPVGPDLHRLRRKGAVTRRIRIDIVAPRGDVGFVSMESVLFPVSSYDVTHDLYNWSEFHGPLCSSKVRDV